MVSKLYNIEELIAKVALKQASLEKDLVSLTFGNYIKEELSMVRAENVADISSVAFFDAVEKWCAAESQKELYDARLLVYDTFNAIPTEALQKVSFEKYVDTGAVAPNNQPLVSNKSQDDIVAKQRNSIAFRMACVIGCGLCIAGAVLLSATIVAPIILSAAAYYLANEAYKEQYKVMNSADYGASNTQQLKEDLSSIKREGTPNCSIDESDNLLTDEEDVSIPSHNK